MAAELLDRMWDVLAHELPSQLTASLGGNPHVAQALGRALIVGHPERRVGRVDHSTARRRCAEMSDRAEMIGWPGRPAPTQTMTRRQRWISD